MRHKLFFGFSKQLGSQNESLTMTSKPKLDSRTAQSEKTEGQMLAGFKFPCINTVFDHTGAQTTSSLIPVCNLTEGKLKGSINDSNLLPKLSSNKELHRKVKFLIIGAGPTGLGAGSRLSQLNEDDWLMVDSESVAGGLSQTNITPQGFLFDLGGHVLFSHYKYFDELIVKANNLSNYNSEIKDVVETNLEHSFNWHYHNRESYVYLKNKYIPYPFQQNLYHLSVDDQLKCINGLIDCHSENRNSHKKEYANFEEFCLSTQGKGICDLFMRDYNYKVWGYPTTELGYKWLGERVAPVDLKETIGRILQQKSQCSWGPNALFKYPKQGGIGGIWQNVANLLPPENQEYNKKVVNFDLNTKTVFLNTGESISYEKCLSTMPLDNLLYMVDKADWAKQLHYSSVHVVGFGIRGENPHATKCWIYYPEDSTCPFYRATVFSHYAPSGNVPSKDTVLPTLRYANILLTTTPIGSGNMEDNEPEQQKGNCGPYWSIMVEVCESKHRKVDSETIVNESILGALKVNLLKEKDEIVSLYHRRLNHGYPTVHVNRDKILDKALPFLQENNVWSRGRFGSYKYEVSNQDHSVLLGVEAVNNMLYQTSEITLNHPNIVNSPDHRKLNDQMGFLQ